ncbi:hypothetical protein IFM89_007618 [Coptis chinensis]|uniref:Uncharacterized protein n=1 Tax=Coptis chinensis TaxID=261450 RepID=A0A835LD68_9MAGN|nr:hypothetical protein IFM89_007618 [Coptis chinensis]
MVKRFREDPNGDESAGKWVRGTSTLPKVFDQPNGSKLELAISKRNRANRAKQIAKHAAGRISFPRFEEIMSRGRIWSTPSLGYLFVRTHTSSQTHDALDDQSREYIHKMKDLAGIDEHGTQLPLSDEIYRK